MTENSEIDSSAEICCVRVEALTYEDKVLTKSGEIDYEKLLNTGCIWKFLDILTGTEEEVKAKLLDYNYYVRVMVRPAYVRYRIRDILRQAGRDAKYLESRGWFSGEAFDCAKKMPNNLGVCQPLNFVEQWRNFESNRSY